MNVPSADDVRALLGLFGLLLIFTVVDSRFSATSRKPSTFEWMIPVFALIANSFGLLWCLMFMVGIEGREHRWIWVAAGVAVFLAMLTGLTSLMGRVRDAIGSNSETAP